MGTTQRVAEWIVNTSYEDIPPDAIRVAAESCFDCLGTILAGSVQPLGKKIVKFVADNGGTPQASVVGTNFATSTPWAALANGTMGHALDYDDMGGFGHPTTVMFPALLALGERSGASGRDLLEAYVVGCEVGINMAAGREYAYGYDQMKRGFHSTAVFGRLAATAAAAKLLKLDAHKTAMALGMATSMAGGLIHNFGTMTKPLHAGLAARDGVMAAELAAQGWTANPTALEHPLGFVYNVYADGGLTKAADLARSLGQPFRTQNAPIIKKYPCCGGNHSMLDSLLGLINENQLTMEDIEEVEVDQSYISVVLLHREPHEGLQGKFSILYNTAHAIAEGKPVIESYTDEKVNDPRIQEAMGKVRLRVKTKWEEEAEGAEGGTPVRLRLKDGRVLERNTARREILGTQFNPWGMDNITDKFRYNASLALPPRQVDAAVTVWGDLRQVSSIQEAAKVVTLM